MNFLELAKPLNISEIDFRIQSINNGRYATILAYKDARVDMNRLDAVFGVGYWQRKHEVIDGRLYCSVGVWNDIIKQWVWLQDVGTESMTEKEKGQASDSFKRACFNLGIGRELYDYPLIQIQLNDNEVKKNDKTNRYQQTYNLKLKEWNWASEFNDKNKIVALAAKDQNNKLRFKWGTFTKKETK